MYMYIYDVSKRFYRITPAIGFNACLHTPCGVDDLHSGKYSSQALLYPKKLFDQQWKSHPAVYSFNPI